PLCCSITYGLQRRSPLPLGRRWGHGARRTKDCRERGRVSRMGSIGRYIFRTTFGAFLVICASVTALMWITQALRDIDLMTNQGQSIFVFVGITSLVIPLLVQIIAPIAVMIAVSHVLNKLGNDSELIVMNAAGMPPWILFRPFLAVGAVVSRLVAAISIYVAPWGRQTRSRAGTVRQLWVQSVLAFQRRAKRQIYRARAISLGVLRYGARRPAVCGSAKSSPRRISRAHNGPALPACVHYSDLR